MNLDIRYILFFVGLIILLFLLIVAGLSFQTSLLLCIVILLVLVILEIQEFVKSEKDGGKNGKKN